MKPNLQNLEGSIFFKNFKIVQKIGAGAFGQIYKVQNTQINNQVLALKMEPINTKFPQLLFEARLLEHIHNEGVKQGIPRVYGVAMENGYNLMLMDLLGKNLDYYFIQNNKKFSLKTVIKIGLQLLDRIEVLHSRGFLHRDIKPDNMIMGLNQKSGLLYLIDMGLSKRFMIEQDYHIPMRKGNQMVGTLRYASISNHKGIQQSRRDDIQSIGYVLVYFLIGNLPWQSIKADSIKSKIEQIKNKKMNTPIQKLCPSQLHFVKFIKHARDLKFEEKPDYQYLRKLLKDAAEQNSIAINDVYDWECLESAQAAQKEEKKQQQKVVTLDN